jgi:hypothetical protein
MKNQARKFKRPSFTTIIAMLALFIAIGGTATAASGLINGKKIKNGSIAGKKLKNKTITSTKISPETLAALAGAKGEKGEKGEKGTNGTNGKDGVDVGFTTFLQTDTANNVAANDETPVVTMNNLPGKRYMILGKVTVQSVGTSIVSCGISTNGGGGSDTSTWSSPVNGSRTTLPVQLTTSVAISHIDLTCNPGNSVGNYSGSLIAVPTN